MKHISAFFACTFLCIGSYLYAPTDSYTNISAFKKLHMEVPVRVLLQENSLTKTNWTLTSPSGFVVYTPSGLKTKVINKNDLTVTHKNGSFYLDTQEIKQSNLFIVPQNGHISSSSRTYDGFFSLNKRNNTAYLVNHLDLEEYLAAVLPYESIPSWPDEVQKALCIACRSYALARIDQHRKHSEHLPYDLKSSVLDQVYKGHEPTVCLKKIVQDTKGMVLTQNEKPILAMYSSVCGGVVPAHKKARIFQKAPYLKRSYGCTHCKGKRLYRWRSSYHLSELEPTLNTLFPQLGGLQDISIGDYDAAGVAHKVRISGSHRCISMEAHDFRMLFDKVRSICCTFSTDNGVLRIQGKGFGHHIGLCQWGAYAMVKKGSSYQDVLSYYYPNTTLTRL